MGLRTSFNSMGALPAANDNYDYPFKDGTAYVVAIPSDGFEFKFCETNINSLVSGHSTYTIDWGDGTQSICAKSEIPSHVYSRRGRYVINYSNEFVRSVGFEGDGSSTSAQTIIKILRFGDAILYTAGGFNGRAGQTAMFAGANITESPPFPEGLLSMAGVFCGCRKLRKSPTIPPTVTTFGYAYRNCSSLKEVPELPSTLTNGAYMFYGCSGLTGAIPELPSGLTNGSYMFDGCSGLTGTWTDDQSKLMPNHVTNHSGHVRNCVAAIRNKYYASWGGTIPNPT